MILWIGGEAIVVLMIGNDGKTCSDVTCWIGGEGIEQVMMG